MKDYVLEKNMKILGGGRRKLAPAGGGYFLLLYTFPGFLSI
jgi:hypothetical protein